MWHQANTDSRLFSNSEDNASDLLNYLEEVLMIVNNV